jgi:hypothetical protein
VRRLSADFIDELDLDVALQEELGAWRNQIPPEPWVAAVKSKNYETVAWIESRLAAGADGLPSAVINARKATVTPLPACAPCVGSPRRGSTP